MLTFEGNASSFRTDSAISGARNQGEGRTLQKWQPDGPADTDGSLESGNMRSSGGAVWDQFAENKRLFNIETDYDENIYTTTIDKSHPQYKQRMADADRKAKEIINKAAFNSHVAEERVQDNVGADDGVDEEDKYVHNLSRYRSILTPIQVQWCAQTTRLPSLDILQLR